MVPTPCPTRATSRSTSVALAALLALVGLVSFVSFSSLVGSATERSASASSAPHLEVSGPHPDFVGVADHRPTSSASLVVAGPLVFAALAAALVAFGAVVLLTHADGHSSRLRRWRARLVGAPPLVA